MPKISGETHKSLPLLVEWGVISVSPNAVVAWEDPFKLSEKITVGLMPDFRKGGKKSPEVDTINLGTTSFLLDRRFVYVETR